MFGDVPYIGLLLVALIIGSLAPAHAGGAFFGQEDRLQMRLATENTVTEKVCEKAIDDTAAGVCPTVDPKEAVKKALEEQLQEAE